MSGQGNMRPSASWGEPMNDQGATPSSATWGGPITPAPDLQWGNAVPPAPQTPQAAHRPQQAQHQPSSLLPAPYQGGGERAVERSRYSNAGGEAQLLSIPMQNTAPLISIPAPSVEEESIYIPPMYTKPRAVIPRYRAISGLFSVLIVFALLCTGASYYARASGKLSFLHQLYGGVLPKDLNPTPTPFLGNPNPPEFGPAQTIITSATTAVSIDSQTAIALQPSQVFSPGQIIYLTYSVHPKTPGTVVFKWYTNDVLYKVLPPAVITEAKNGYSTMEYSQPVEGKVELYWNDQLAITLFFVVR